MSSKFAIENENMLQLLGDFVPQTSYRGSALDPAGGLPSPRPSYLCISKISFKKPWFAPDPPTHRTGSHHPTCVYHGHDPPWLLQLAVGGPTASSNRRQNHCREYRTVQRVSFSISWATGSRHTSSSATALAANSSSCQSCAVQDLNAHVWNLLLRTDAVLSVATMPVRERLRSAVSQNGARTLCLIHNSRKCRLISIILSPSYFWMNCRKRWYQIYHLI